MRVVIFKSEFQYDVVNDFAKSIGQTLLKYGVEVIFVNLINESATQEIANAFTKPVDFVLSFNGVGCNLLYNNQSFYDYVGTTFVMWLVDHPVHLMERVQISIKNKVVICIDESHVDYLEKNLKKPIITSFIAHAANKEVLEVSEKQYDILFAGHIADPGKFELQINKINETFPGFLKLVDDELLHNGNVHLDLLFEKLNVAFPEMLILNESEPEIKENILSSVDRYIRTKKRTQIIRELLKYKFTIDFFGPIPEKHEFLSSPYFKNHPSVSFDKMKKLYKKSKLVLNVMPNFPHGGHERIFESMMCGAIPLTDINGYIEKHLSTVISFKYNDLSSQIEEIQRLLSNDAVLEDKIKENYDAVTTYHTWENRVEELLYVVEAAKNYFDETK